MNYLRTLRLRIDEVAQLLDDTANYSEPANPYNSTPEGNVLKAIESARMAKAWGGKLAGELGEENPYKMDGKRTTVADIEPTDAVADNERSATRFGYSNSKTYVAKIDFLRQALEEIAYNVRHLDKDILLTTREQNICRTQMWTHLVEAKIFLGLELGNLHRQTLALVA